MQAATDAAALSGAQNLTLVGATARQFTADVERFAMAQVGEFASRATVSFQATQGSDAATQFRAWRCGLPFSET
jgi:hypothetical protein